MITKLIGYRQYQDTKSQAGVDFTNCGHGYYCSDCDADKRHDCEWEADRLHYEEYHKQAVNRFLAYLISGGK